MQQDILHLSAAGRVDLIEEEFLAAPFLDERHLLLVLVDLQAGAVASSPPAAAEDPDVALQLQQPVVQAPPLRRLLPVEEPHLLRFPLHLQLRLGQPPRRRLQLLQLALHVAQCQLGGRPELLARDVELAADASQLDQRPQRRQRSGSSRWAGLTPPTQKRADLLLLLLLLGLQLGQPVVKVLDDLAEVVHLPGQVAVPLEETLCFLPLAVDLLLQLLNDLVPLQQGSVVDTAAAIVAVLLLASSK